MTRRDVLKKGLGAAAVLAAGGTGAALRSGGWTAIAGEPYDCVIRGGLVYDGISSEPRQADVAVRGDRITAVGRIEGPAARVVQADGLIVMPGFIDVHTHCDLTFKRSGLKRHLARVMPSWKGNYNYLHQGVTTVVTGNCGYGYTDVDYWFGLLEDIGFGTNVYHLAPHGMLREALFGPDHQGPLNASQLDRLAGRVEEEMQKGAVGLSAGLEYAPGIWADVREISTCARAARKHGGLFTVHMRDESGAVKPGGRPALLESIAEVVEAARQAEVGLEISHLKISAPYNDLRPGQVFDLIEEARRQGLDVTADQYPYTAGSTYISILLPDEFKSGLGVKDRYKTRSGQVEIEKAMAEVFSYLPPDRILISFDPNDETREGKTLEVLAETTGRTPARAYAEMVCEDPPPTGIFFMMKEADVRALMQPDYVMTASDGWTVPKDMTKPHPRCYGTFPKKIREYVLKERIVDLPRAIRSMTSQPAEKFRLKDRGRIEVGYFADIAVIDLKGLNHHASYLDPHQYASGVRHLLVNGVAAIENGQATGERGGRACRRS